MTVSSAVAIRIRQLLKEKKMTQYRLEKNAHIQHGSMQCIMNGRNKTVKLNTVMMIAQGFGMTVDEFLNDEIFRSEALELE